MKINKLLILVGVMLMQLTLFGSQTPEGRAFSDKSQALSSLVAVTFGDSNLYSPKKQWDNGSIDQWQNFINITIPNYIKLLQPNDQSLNAMMSQIQQSNKELIYCIKIIKADSNLVVTAKKTLQDIQVKMQKIQKELSSASQKGAGINKQYRQSILNALAIAIEQTAKKAINDLLNHALEEDWALL